MMHGGIFRYRRTADDDTEKWGDTHGRDPYKYTVLFRNLLFKSTLFRSIS